jgi:hypothetical protein
MKLRRCRAVSRTGTDPKATRDVFLKRERHVSMWCFNPNYGEA